MSIPEKVPQEQEPIAPSSADSASTSPRSTRSLSRLLAGFSGSKHRENQDF